MEKIVLILLTARDSRRFNGDKLLYPFNGKLMHRYLMDEIGKSSETLSEKRIAVIQYQETMDALGKEGYLVVGNHESELGIPHPTELRIRAVEVWGDYGLCFAVYDQPYLKRETVRTLVDGFLWSGRSIDCFSYQGELGNSTVLPNGYREELLALEGDVGGRRIIRCHPDDLFLCGVEDGRELADVDMKKG